MSCTVKKDSTGDVYKRQGIHTLFKEILQILIDFGKGQGIKLLPPDPKTFSLIFSIVKEEQFFDRMIFSSRKAVFLFLI